MNIDTNLSVKITDKNITVLTEYQRYALEHLFAVKCKVAAENDEDTCKGSWCSAREVIRRAFGEIDSDPDVIDGAELAEAEEVVATND